MGNLSIIQFLTCALLLFPTMHIKGNSLAAVAGEYIPDSTVDYRTMDMGTFGEPFKVCADCRCCSGSNCRMQPCCFRINCTIPNKPFGTCAFTPKACNCTDCPS